MTEAAMITRMDPPRNPDTDFWGADHSAELGGKARWYWPYAAALHALASPSGLASLPAAPRQACSAEWSHGYWATLHQLLLYRLGWSDPARGLMRWYDAGKPTDDPVLTLVGRVWDADDCLDPYLAWLLHARTGLRGAHRWSGTSPIDDLPLDDRWARWLRSVEDRWTEDRWPWFSPHSGDPLHLYRSATQQGPDDVGAALHGPDRVSRRATLITTRADSWYGTLTRLGNTLPEVSMSWKVEVHDRSLGYLGTYRRSLVTGLWFAGRHRVHVAGNPARAVASVAPRPW